MIIKIGGGKTINIDGIARDIGEFGQPSIILHGANAYRDDLLHQLDIKKRTVTSVSGYSSVVSTQELIDVMMMSYAGLRNKQIVSLFQQHGLNAVGLSGLDGQLIKGRRNRGIRIIEQGKKKILRDLSGKADHINTDLLHYLLDNSYVPVITVPVIDEDGFAINSENDDILSLLGETLQPKTIISFIEARGLMRDIMDPTSIIDTINSEEMRVFEEGTSGRIKRKIYALRKLRNACDADIYLADGRIASPIKSALKGNSTRILV